MEKSDGASFVPRNGGEGFLFDLGKNKFYTVHGAMHKGKRWP